MLSSLEGYASRVVPALEIGGSHVTAGILSLDPAGWRVIRSERLSLLSDAPRDVLLRAILDAANWADAPGGSVWGVAVPGPFDYAHGLALFQCVGKFESLHGVNLRDRLMAISPSPSGVIFINDADAFLTGEWLAGVAAGWDRCVGITLGTGIGSSWLAHGRTVLTGPSVPPGGDVHRLRVAGRPLEDTVSTRAIVASYEYETGRRLDVREIAGLARSGEPVASRVLADAFQALGSSLAPWLLRFRADALVVGGQMTGSWELLKPAFRAGLERIAPFRSLSVLRSPDPDRSALVGAAHAAITAVAARATRPARDHD